MGCYDPLVAKVLGKTASGKKNLKIVGSYSRFVGFKVEGNWNLPDDMVKLPCGQCIGCRLERSKQWAVRCVHEASLHEQNCFITLTYNDEHLPKYRTLVKKHYQDFMKRLRKEFPDIRIRYYHCGEYGDLRQRPHYHAILFGFDFPDKYYWKTVNGNTLYTSEILNKIWGKGYTVVAGVSFDSCAYVARYIMKKINGKKADEELTYAIIDYETGEYLGDRQKEYTTMSRANGIGFDYLLKYKNDIYTKDVVILEDKKLKPPRYYDNIFDIDNHEEMENIKNNRKLKSNLLTLDNTPDRLKVKQEVTSASLSFYKKRHIGGF